MIHKVSYKLLLNKMIYSDSLIGHQEYTARSRENVQEERDNARIRTTAISIYTHCQNDSNVEK